MVPSLFHQPCSHPSQPLNTPYSTRPARPPRGATSLTDGAGAPGATSTTREAQPAERAPLIPDFAQPGSSSRPSPKHFTLHLHIFVSLPLLSIPPRPLRLWLSKPRCRILFFDPSTGPFLSLSFFSSCFYRPPSKYLPPPFFLLPRPTLRPPTQRSQASSSPNPS